MRESLTHHLIWTVLNEMDRFHVVQDVIDGLPDLHYAAAYLKEEMKDKLIEYTNYSQKNGVDMAEILDWKWAFQCKKPRF